MIAPLLDTLTLALAALLCLPGATTQRRRNIVLAAGCAVLLWLPIAGTTPLAAWRGMLGSFSVTRCGLLLALVLHRHGLKTLHTGEARALAGLAGGIGLLFYPAALGLIATDPYAWGYAGAGGLALVTGGVAILAWLGGWRSSALILATPLLAWRLDLLASPNLWDALLDPLLALGGLLALLVSVLGRRR